VELDLGRQRRERLGRAAVAGRRVADLRASSPSELRIARSVAAAARVASTSSIAASHRGR
jgi:hypothetical protein